MTTLAFYLGTHMPHWLTLPDVPRLFISNRRLVGRRRLPRATGPWALDSGGFSELSMYGQWRTTPQEYITAIRRYDNEIGNLEWAAPQDWMCEATMLARTGKTVAEHQRLTIENFRQLRDLWWATSPDTQPLPDMCPIMPVLQGQTRDDYHRHADAYYQAGFRLEEWPVVGLGSVCRRQATHEIDNIVRSLTPSLALHGFGCKAGALTNVGNLLTSADSLAWSYGGRREPGCTPTHKNEANCLPYALAWRERTLAAIGDRLSGQMDLFTQETA